MGKLYNITGDAEKLNLTIDEVKAWFHDTQDFIFDESMIGARIQLSKGSTHDDTWGETEYWVKEVIPSS